MGLESFIKKSYEKTKDVIGDTIEARNRRFSDPAFQAELGIEKTKFKESLKNTGERAANAAYYTLFKAPLKPLFNALTKRRYSAGDAVIDSFKGFGKAGWETTKFIGSVAGAAGRATKLGTRWLIAK
jgi:hypothetical protein